MSDMAIGALLAFGVVVLVSLVLLWVDHRVGERHRKLDEALAQLHRILLTNVRNQNNTERRLALVVEAVNDHADLFEAMKAPRQPRRVAEA